MSYDIYLNDPVTKEKIQLESPHHMRGGTYCLGGDPEAHVNMTYNYSGIICGLLGEKSIRSIYGLSGAASLPTLRDAVSKLKDDVSTNYWEATEGNVKRSLMQLIALAEMHPDGIWDGD